MNFIMITKYLKMNWFFKLFSKISVLTAPGARSNTFISLFYSFNNYYRYRDEETLKY